MKRPCLLFLMLWGLVVGVACGLKGKPVPPQALVPQNIRDLRVIQQKEHIALAWTVPQKRKDGSQMGNLLGFEVFRKEQRQVEFKRGEGEGDMEGLTDAQEELLKTLNRGPRFRQEGNQLWKGEKIDESPYMRTTQIILKDPSPARMDDDIITLVDEGKDLPSGFVYGKQYSYLVFSFNRDGLRGEPSNQAEVLIVPPPCPPFGLVALSGSGKASLYWQSPTENSDGTPITDLKGFNIYRSAFPGQYLSTPINEGLIEKNSFRDGNLQNNQKYYYIVQAIKGDPLTGQESEKSNEVEVISTDQTPPRRPQKLMGVRGEDFINLTWEVNQEDDLQGYHIYRSTTPGSGYRRLASSSITHTTYIDRKVRPNQTYYYVITAVDNASPINESEFSSEIGVDP